MAAIRLISEELFTYLPDCVNNTLIKRQNYILPKPKGRFFIVCFINHTQDLPQIPSIVRKAIDKDIGVVYVCDKLPKKPIIDEHIHYIEAPDKWFLHTLFLNPLMFSAVFSSRQAQRLALAFSEFTKYHIPVIRKDRDIERLSKQFDSVKNNVLVEVFGGVGDHLMTIPSLKTLASKGKNVYVLCDAHRNECYQNLPYIKGFYTRRNEVDISRFQKVIYLNFGQLLNDYRQDFNKQNRIYSVAELCGFRPEELVIDRPEIILTADEKNNAERKWGPYKNRIFIGYDSARVDSKLPNNMAQDIINKFKSRGYTSFITSVRRHSFNNCIDLNKKLSLREMFALIAMMDCVLTVDTSFLHVAGAFNKKTFCIMNYFKPEWRCSTYKNCTAYKPNVACYPCVSKQFVSSKEWCCHKKSCYEYQNWENIFSDIREFFNKKDLSEKETITFSKDEIKVPKIIDENILPGKVVKVRPKKEKRIAAFWMGGLGDAVMLSYLCRVIKRKYPDSNIDAFIRDRNQIQVFVFDNPDIKAQHSNFSWQKTFNLIKDDYDIIYEFRPYPYVWHISNPELNKPFNKELYNNWQKSTGYMLDYCYTQTFKYYAFKTGLKLCDEDMQIPIVNNNSHYYNLNKKYNLPEKYITLSSGCDQNVGIMKLWPKEKWQELIYKLDKDGYSVIQLGDDSDKSLSNIRKIKCENIIDLMYVLKFSDLHITNEGGLVHLAHAVNTKSVVLFGPTTPRLYGYPDNINIYHSLCKSCWWTVHGWSNKCKKGYDTCKNIDAIDVDEVYRKIIGGLK